MAQRVWAEGGYPQDWDSIIDGVQWRREADGKIWFDIYDREAARFQVYAGKDNRRSFEAWDALEVGLGKVATAERRIAGYQGAKLADFKKLRDRKAFVEKENWGVEAIDKPVGTPVLAADKEVRVAKTGWTQVDHPFETSLAPKGNTKFINMFHLPRLDGEVDALVMMENYRERAREFFASDAFFDQWMRVQEVANLCDLPRTFPRWVYRNNISNEVLAEKLNAVLDGRDEMDIVVGDHNWRDLEPTDNIKSTNNILVEYNTINATRGEPPSRIVAMRIYKGPAIRFEVRK